jgi:hypothetical protein
MTWKPQVDPLTGILYMNPKIRSDMKQQYYFIKITQDHWTSKNKLQALIKEKMKGIDKTLAFSLEDAKKVVRRAFDEAHRECQSRCTPVPWYDHSYVKGELHIQFSGIIHISIYQANEVYFEG